MSKCINITDSLNSELHCFQAWTHQELVRNRVQQCKHVCKSCVPANRIVEGVGGAYVKFGAIIWNETSCHILYNITYIDGLCRYCLAIAHRCCGKSVLTSWEFNLTTCKAELCPCEPSESKGILSLHSNDRSHCVCLSIRLPCKCLQLHCLRIESTRSFNHSPCTEDRNWHNTIFSATIDSVSLSSISILCE